jgi:DinB superfamily
VGHLIAVERTVLAGADDLLRQPPKPLAFFRRLHFPLALVEARLIRRQTPLPLDPQLIQSKEEMLADLREVRERTLAFIEEKRGQDLKNHHRKHPFLGTLNVSEWLQFVASHQVRHAKQMREIVEALQKSIERVQK